VATQAAPFARRICAVASSKAKRCKFSERKIAAGYQLVKKGRAQVRDRIVSERDRNNAAPANAATPKGLAQAKTNQNKAAATRQGKKPEVSHVGDRLERITTQTVMDILEVPQRQRTAGTYRHLASLMAELGWTPVRVRDFNGRGLKEQIRGYVRSDR
jgi:hypothetical protein